MIQENKFGFIWSCILKVINFIIFRNFLEFFIIYLNLFLILKEEKNDFYLSRVDVAEYCHVATRVRVTWQPIYAYVSSHVCASMCACARESD